MLALTAALIAVAPTAVVAKSGASDPTCRIPSHHRHVLASAQQLRAWLQVGPASGRFGYEAAHVYVCAPPDGRVHAVFGWEYEQGAVQDSAQISGVQIDGPIMGFDYKTSSQYAEDQELVVVSATGKRLVARNVEAWPIDDPNCSPCFGSYAIDSSGDLAWIATSGTVSGADASDALDLQIAGSRTALTIASAASLSGVALANGAISWDASGVQHSEPIATARQLAGRAGPPAPADRGRSTR